MAKGNRRGGGARRGKGTAGPQDGGKATSEGSAAGEQLSQRIKTATAATGNIEYNPETDGVTIGKGQDKIEIKPVDVLAPDDPAIDLAAKMASLKTEWAPVGTNSVPEMMAYLQKNVDTVDALRLAKSYIGSLGTLSRCQRKDGTYCYTGVVTPLRETDGASDVSLRLIDGFDGSVVSAEEYGWFLRVNGRVVEQRFAGRTAAEDQTPGMPFPKVLPFAVIPMAPISVEVVMEQSSARRFRDLWWELSFTGWCFGNPPARFARNANTWGWLNVVVDGQECTLEMKASTTNFQVGSWEDVQTRRRLAEAEQQKKAAADAAEAVRNDPLSAKAQLEKLCA